LQAARAQIRVDVMYSMSTSAPVSAVKLQGLIEPVATEVAGTKSSTLYGLYTVR